MYQNKIEFFFPGNFVDMDPQNFREKNKKTKEKHSVRQPAIKNRLCNWQVNLINLIYNFLVSCI